MITKLVALYQVNLPSKTPSLCVNVVWDYMGFLLLFIGFVLFILFFVFKYKRKMVGEIHIVFYQIPNVKNSLRDC